MVKIGIIINEGKVSRIRELELERYVNFFCHSHEDNLKHSRTVIEAFPRWSIISGYYAMHDITKLLLAKQFGLKVEYEVHATTIKVLKELIRKREILNLMDRGYREFLSLANDLVHAKRNRVKAQYYTGTEYMKQEYRKRAREFLKEVVEPYLPKINQLVEEEND